jgi:ligand-binding SRPBCC domain-containing protein
MKVNLTALRLNPPAGSSAPIAGTGSELLASFRPIPSLPFRITSGARITAFAMNQYFEDIQTRGPFKSWHHRHEFRAETRNQVAGTVIRDVIDYEAGFGLLGDLAQGVLIGPQLQRTFQFRQRALEKLLT